MELTIIQSSVTLFEILCVIIVFASIFMRSRFFNEVFEHHPAWTTQILLMVFFGIMSVFGTLSGLTLHGAVVNVRDLGPMVAGLVCGPYIGIGAGIIGGLFRFAQGGAYIWTGLSAPILSGFLGGIMYLANKRQFVPTWVAVLLIGLSETFISCYTLILVTKPSEFFNVVTTVAIPMIVFNVIGMVIFAMVVHNILDEKNIQKKMQLLELEVESKRNLSAIINTISYPVYVLDRNQRFVLVNDSFCRFIGRSKDEILIKTPLDFFPEGDSLFHINLTNENFQSQKTRENEVTITIPSGQKCTIISTSTVFKDAPCPGFVVGIIQDITGRKQTEEALRETNENLKEENSQRLDAEEKLKKSYDEKVILLQEVHHRVKNNLQIIVSLLNLQSRYIKDDPTLAAIKDSQNRVKAMALVHEKLYRSEDISYISLDDYIKFLGTGLFSSYDAESRGITFTADIHDINVDIDVAIPLGLLINELISNSLKYAFPDDRRGEIFVSVKKEDHTLTILFRDNGCGIPADLDWRNAPSLGLRLVTTLVDQMNGTVELDRRAGTIFTIVVKEKEEFF